jgi:hypothetical protein
MFSLAEDKHFERTKDYTQVIAVINPANFSGNLEKYTLTRMMHPNRKSSRKFITTFSRFFGTIPNEEMRRPQMLDQNEEACITVLKRGRSTNLAVGKTTNLASFTKYFRKHDTVIAGTSNLALFLPKAILALL